MVIYISRRAKLKEIENSWINKGDKRDIIVK
jgi:hypothetical protein